MTPTASALKNSKAKRDLCRGSWQMLFDFPFDDKNTYINICEAKYPVKPQHRCDWTMQLLSYICIRLLHVRVTSKYVSAKSQHIMTETDAMRVAALKYVLIWWFIHWTRGMFPFVFLLCKRDAAVARFSLFQRHTFRWNPSMNMARTISKEKITKKRQSGGNILPISRRCWDIHTLFQLFSSFTQDLIGFSPLEVYNLRTKYFDTEPTDCLSKMYELIWLSRVGRLFNRFFFYKLSLARSLLKTDCWFSSRNFTVFLLNNGWFIYKTH